MKWRATKRKRGWVKADEAKALGQVRDREDERRAIEEGYGERPCPTCNDEGLVHDLAGNTLGPCDCASS